MRGKCSDFRQRLPAVNQRWAADGNLDWAERVQLATRFDLSPGAYVFHLCYPGLVRWGPGRIENNCARLAQTGRQRKLRIPYANLVRLDQPTCFKDVHPVSRSIYHYPRIARYSVRDLTVI